MININNIRKWILNEKDRNIKILLTCIDIAYTSKIPHDKKIILINNNLNEIKYRTNDKKKILLINELLKENN